MYIDILLLFLIATTPVTFDKDCWEGVDAYHNVVEYIWNDYRTITSRINYCDDTIDKGLQVHEIGHEFHHRLRELARTDDKAIKEIEFFDIIYALSGSGDFISDYARTTVNEDFAETFKYVYFNDYIPTYNTKLTMKIKYMNYMINKYNKNIELIPVTK